MDRNGAHLSTHTRSDASAVEQRVISHLGLARTVAGRSIDPRCRGADREDLVAWGVLGLVQAAQRYREGERASFAAFAARRVRGQVLDALRDRDPLTRSARRAYRVAREADPDLPPPAQEVSLDRYMEHGAEPPPVVRACRASQDARWARVSRELRALPPLERRVLGLMYGRGLTLRETGLRVGLSESGVCRARARALARLRERCRGRSSTERTSSDEPLGARRGGEQTNKSGCHDVATNREDLRRQQVMPVQ